MWDYDTLFHGKNYHDPYFYSEKKMKVRGDSRAGFAFILVFKSQGGSSHLQVSDAAVCSCATL